MSDPERVRLLDFAAAEAELTQLRAQVKWLREANKSLSDELEKVRKRLPPPPEAFV
jgi:regulator of replication initiation timing